MILGFTGTRLGMNDFQMEAFKSFMDSGLYRVAVHGGCVGADHDFHKLCKAMGMEVHVRPGHSIKSPYDTTNRFDFSDADLIWPSRPYFSRNRDIVEQCDHLLGAPPCNKDPHKGGSWFTLRYAKGRGTPSTILLRHRPLDHGVKELAGLARRDHRECPDPWYSCPASEHGCADDRLEEGVCNCGADDHNKKVDSLLESILHGLD